MLYRVILTNKVSKSKNNLFRKCLIEYFRLSSLTYRLVSSLKVGYTCPLTYIVFIKFTIIIESCNVYTSMAT